MANGLMTKTVSRQELYDLAWQEPMLRVAERFGVSSSYLARVYTELKIPRPAPGYWAQREFGKSPPKPDLPPALPGRLTEWSPGSSIGTAVRSVKKAVRSVEAGKSDGTGVVAAESSPSRHHKTSARKSSLASARHELLTGVEALFLKTRDTDNGILRPYKRLLVDVMTSAPKLEMALDAAQMLFEALEGRGFHVAFSPAGVQMSRDDVDLLDRQSKRNYYRKTWSPDRPTVVYVGEVAIGLTLFEMTEEVEAVYVSGDYLPVRDLSAQQLRRYTGSHHWRTEKEYPSGRLCVQAYCPYGQVKWSKRWQQVKPGSISEMVPGIVKELEAIAPQLARQVQEAKLRAEEARRRWDEERQREKAEAERLRRQKAKQDSRADLLAAIESWNAAKGVLDYFVMVEVELGGLPDEEAAHIRERLLLAKELIGEVDPLALLKNWKAPHER